MDIEKSEKPNYVKCLIALFTTLILLVSTYAHADFRKALIAYQARDGQTMLVEMHDAVNKKNHNGLVLFLSVLETDAWLAKSSESSLNPFENLLNKNELDSFVKLLKTMVANGYPMLQLRLFGYFQASSAINRSELSELAGSNFYAKAYFAGDSTYEAMAEAQRYLLGHPGYNGKNVIAKDEAEGLRLFKKALARPDAYLYWGSYNKPLSQFYYKKYLQNKNKSYLHQAYAWAVLDFTNGIFFSSYIGEEVPAVIKEMQKNGLLRRIAPELDAALSLPHKADDKKARERRVQAIWKSIEYAELPELIRKNHKFDLNIQPVISLQRINYDSWRTMMGDEYMTGAGTSISNFSLEIYEDGRVVYTQGQKGMPEFNKVQNSEVLLKISPDEVNWLLANVNVMVSQASLVTIGTQEYGHCPKIFTFTCGWAEHQISFAHNYSVSVRDRKRFRTVKFLGSNLTSNFAKVFKLIEGRIPTQQYRCGTDKGNNYYPYCVNRDKQIFEVANVINK